ncbi:MAG: hypothetical protein FIA96_13205 [Betaproteobacteria bacterium]|nr:hypothetical protein [Betaproteobacteria bacterium]
MFRRLLVLLMLGVASHGAAAAEDLALVTAVTGSVSRLVGNAPRALEPFARLKQGELVLLEAQAGVRLIFFESRRQESWQGEGRIEIGRTQGKGIGLPEPQVSVLPELMARQIAKTPSLDNQVRAASGRLRSIEIVEGGLAKLDSDYSRLRKDAALDDINPEIFLLAGLFEMREFARLEQTLKDLSDSRPGNMEVSVLKALYKKAIAQKQQL